MIFGVLVVIGGVLVGDFGVLVVIGGVLVDDLWCIGGDW